METIFYEDALKDINDVEMHEVEEVEFEHISHNEKGQSVGGEANFSVWHSFVSYLAKQIHSKISRLVVALIWNSILQKLSCQQELDAQKIEFHAT